MTDRTLQPGEVVQITEEQAAQLLALEPTGFFVGYDDPDWDYFHAPRAATRKTAKRGGKVAEVSGPPQMETR